MLIVDIAPAAADVRGPAADVSLALNSLRSSMRQQAQREAHGDDRIVVGEKEVASHGRV